VRASSLRRVTIFGVSWQKLGLEHVERFLEGAGREALTWEAKGTELRADQVTKHVGGFANAADGGYLLLGFEPVDDEWRTSGLDFPGGDPPVWISNVVRTTLRPRPRIDVRDWDVSGRRAAVSASTRLRTRPASRAVGRYLSASPVRPCSSPTRPNSAAFLASPVRARLREATGRDARRITVGAAVP
jgi:hypothetical protein